MPRILALTTEPIPLAGMPATGAGLRAWGLAQGLRGAGLDVSLWIPANAWANYPQYDSAFRSGERPDWIGSFDRTTLNDAVREFAPDAIVLQHWGLAREMGPVKCPLAIDLAGPHLLERKLWGSSDPEADLMEKIEALRRADFLTASGERQRLYFMAFAQMAGWPADQARPLPVIPFAMKAAPEPPPIRNGRFIYGGYFLPWQDPSTVLEAALRAMDAAGRGELLFIGGMHPQNDVSRGSFATLTERLSAHPRVRMIEPMPFDRYQALLAEGGVALDCMAPNAERELAFTTRTVVYLAAGLPVVHHDYSETGALIAETGAGWACAPDDAEGLENLLGGILHGEQDLAGRASAALRLVNERLDWDATIRPLADFCRDPRRREGRDGAGLDAERLQNGLSKAQNERDALRAELATLHGKRWVRWGLCLTSWRRKL